MKCRVCERDLASSAFAPGRLTCASCFAGQSRLSALARQRVPHLFELRGEARECVLAFETARLAFSRALRPAGVHVTWRGFEPRVSVVSRAGGKGACPLGEPAA